MAGDRDTLMTAYMSRGFEQVTVEVGQQIEAADPNKVDVAFRIVEGQQVFIRKVLLTGLHYTRPETVARAITIHAGDVLNQTALLDTQRNLYNYALFNEVNTAIENPNGGEPEKTVLLQLTEARRWTLTYGFGFEAQTGQPQNNCAGAIAAGVACNPNGKTGVSPRVLPATASSAGNSRPRCKPPTACSSRASGCSTRFPILKARGTSASASPAATPTAKTLPHT
jgi:hypothetical protein